MKICSIFFASVLMLAASGAGAQERTKIGYVNGSRIQNESVPAQRVLETLKKEFGPREKVILDLQKQISVAREQFDKERNSLPPAELVLAGPEAMKAAFEAWRKERG